MKEKHISGHPLISKPDPKKTQWHPPFCASIRLELIKELKQEGLSVDKKSAGIYQVNFPILGGIYILVTRELDKQEHIWLTSLSNHMCEEDTRTLLRETGKLTQKDDREYADAVLQIAMERNKELFDREKEDADMCEAFWELFQPEIEAEKKNSELCGKKQGIEIGEYTKLISQIGRKIQRGKDIAAISDALEESEDIIRPIYEAVLASPNLSAGQIYEQLFAKQ